MFRRSCATVVSDGRDGRDGGCSGSGGMAPFDPPRSLPRPGELWQTVHGNFRANPHRRARLRRPARSAGPIAPARRRRRIRCERRPHSGAACRTRPNWRGRWRGIAHRPAACDRRRRRRGQAHVHTSSPCRRPIDGNHRPDLAPMLRASRTVGQHLKKGDVRRLRVDRLPRRHRGDLRPDPRARVRAPNGRRLLPRLLARAHQPGRQGAHVRDDHEGRLGPGRRDARPRRAVYGSVVRPASTARRRSRWPRRRR